MCCIKNVVLYQTQQLTIWYCCTRRSTAMLQGLATADWHSTLESISHEPILE